MNAEFTSEASKYEQEEVISGSDVKDGISSEDNQFGFVHGDNDSEVADPELGAAPSSRRAKVKQESISNKLLMLN